MNENFSPPEESLIQESAAPQAYLYDPEDGDEEKVGLESAYPDGGRVDSEDENEVTIK